VPPPRIGEGIGVWLAIDEKTREIVGCFIGSCGAEGAQGLWNSLPAVYRQCAVCYTDDFDKLSTSFGKLMLVSFLLLVLGEAEVNVTVQWAKKLVKQVISKASIIP